ncbi:MAG: hypothetical protein EBU90_08160 [Proteobacteria bacterium]|nr:hypothetical protein [Pseudomonadota bacterium]NBP14909.1 hypothetical protein [bacterium]
MTTETVPCICVTLNDCLTGATVYYYTCKTTNAGVLNNITQGTLIEINDSTNFPNNYYTYQSQCNIPGNNTAQCTACSSAPNKIVDDAGTSLLYWTPQPASEICPNLNSNTSVYALVNCLSGSIVTESTVDQIVNSPLMAMITSSDLYLYADMIVNIDGYPDNCYKVSGPFTPGEGAPVRPTVTITNAYSTCECCLPPPPPPGCCEIPKYTQKPVKDFFRITVSDEDIKANTSFANNYYKLYMGMRYGVNSCCTGIDYEKLWINKQVVDFELIKHSECVAVLPTLCLYVTGNDPCGSQVATYNDFINGKWSFKFTRNTGANGIIYWDIENSYWVIKNEDTGVIAAKLPINSDYPIGTNDQWLVVNKAACFSPDCGLSTWTVDCSYYEQDTCNDCDKPQNAVAS